MTRTAAEAVKAAKATSTNRPGMCQMQTRTWLQGPSAGDVDHDGDSDAVDGWKSEPTTARHTDKNPPAGAPVAWSGGSGGFGHRALSLGGGMIRSTDANGRGKVGTQHIDWFEQHWGLHYLGWSETITGQPIPGLKVSPSSAAVKPKPKPNHVQKANAALPGWLKEGDKILAELNAAEKGRDAVESFATTLREALRVIRSAKPKLPEK